MTQRPRAQFRALVFLFCGFLFASTVAAQPRPEFFGIYAVSDGKLVELREFWQPNHALGRGHFVGSANGPAFPLDQPLYFILYGSTADIGSSSYFASQIEQLTYAIEVDRQNNTVVEELPNPILRLSDTGYLLRVAPLPTEVGAMFKLVPEGLIAAGEYGLPFDGKIYSFSIGDAPGRRCFLEDRRNTISFFIERADKNEGWQSCEEVFSKHPGLRPERSTRRQVAARAGAEEAAMEADDAPSACPTAGKPVLQAIVGRSVRVGRVPDVRGPLLSWFKNLNGVTSLGVVQDGFCQVNVPFRGAGWIALEDLRAPGGSDHRSATP